MAADSARLRTLEKARAHEPRRGSQACEGCRSGKRKCDGARPVCGTCSKRGPRATCVYEKSGGRRGRTSKQIELLEKRIAELEGSRFSVPESPKHGSPDAAQAEFLGESSQVGPPVSPSQYAPLRAPVSEGSSRLGQYPNLLSPQFSNLVAGDVPAEQDTPRVRTLSRDVEHIRRHESVSDSHFDDEPKLVGGRVDGMGTVASDVTDLNDLCADRIGYFGMSSTVNFVNEVHRILIESSNGHSPSVGVAAGQQPSEDEAWRRFQTTPRIESRMQAQRPVEEYVVPPRKEADAILELFWLRVHPLYPFLDREKFERDYAEIWATESSSSAENSSGPVLVGSPDYRYQYPSRRSPGHQIPKSRRFHVLLNTMFALGCRCDTSETVARQAQRGEMFWKRCKDLLELDFDIFNQPCIEFILAYLLMGIYLQSTTELTGACWNFVGLSIRLAQSLGLHCSSNLSFRKSDQDGGDPSRDTTYNLLRWRTWAGLVLMDRTLATTYGRPPMISSKAARIHLPPELARQGMPPSASSTSLQYLISLVKLQEILKDIVTHFNDDETAAADENGDAVPQYGHGTEEASMMFKAPSLIRQIQAGDFQDLVNFEANLLAWERDLPASLRLAPTMELIAQAHPVSSVDRQSVVLRARYLYGHVLFFRPLLLHQMARAKYRRQDLRDSDTVLLTLGNTLLDRGPTMCINAAAELVLLIDWVQRNKSDSLPEPWYTIFYLYTCGMVLLVHRHCATNVEYTNHAWMKCLDALTSYTATSRTALGCLKLLRLSDSCFLSRPPPPAAPPEPAQSTSHEVAIPPAATHEWPAGANPEFPCMGADMGMSDFHDMPQSQVQDDGFPISWTDDQIDLAWLSTVPFELGVDNMENMFF